MEAGFIALAIVMIIMGVVIGFYIGKKRAERRYTNETQYTQGVLNVDCSDPEFQPGLFLGLAVPVSEVISKKYVVFNVNLFTKNSRE